jgi:hypothetical protein
MHSTDHAVLTPATASGSPVPGQYLDSAALGLMLKQVFAVLYDTLFEAAFEENSEQRQSSNLELIRRARPQEDAIIERTWTELASQGSAHGPEGFAIPPQSDPAQQQAWQESLREAFARSCLPLAMTEEQRSLLYNAFAKRLCALLDVSAPDTSADIAAPAEPTLPVEHEASSATPEPIIEHAPTVAVAAHIDALASEAPTRIKEPAASRHITEPDVVAPLPQRGPRWRPGVALGLAVLAVIGALSLMFPQAIRQAVDEAKNSAPARRTQAPQLQPPVPQTAVTHESRVTPPAPQPIESSEAEDEPPAAPLVAEAAAPEQGLPPEPSAAVITAHVPSTPSAATPASPIGTEVAPDASMGAAPPETAATAPDLSVTTPDPVMTAQLNAHMQRGDTALAELRLTLPFPDSAMANYLAVLAIDANHAGAQQGLRRVVQRYADLVTTALAKGDPARATLLLSRARPVLPDDTRLQAPGLTPEAFARRSWDTMAD